MFLRSHIVESPNIRTISTKDPELYKEIMLIASDARQGFDLQGYKNVLKGRGLNISHESLVYKALQILVRSNLLIRGYSAERKGVVYRMVYRSNISLV